MSRQITVRMLGTLLLATSLASQLSAQQEDWQRLSARVASLFLQGQYGDALPLAEQALRVAEATWGAEHANVAISLHNLGDLKRVLGKYAESESLFRRELAMQEKLVGPDRPEVADSLNDLVMLYEDENEYPKSEPLCRRALNIREKVFGPDHPSVAQSLNNLAAIYQVEGRYADAEPLFQRGIRIVEKARGPQHPDLAALLTNLAGVYQDEGKPQEAEPLLQRALRILEGSRGPNHPEVATLMNNLGKVYQAETKYAEAETLFQRGLSIWEKTLGPEHPLVATAASNLGLLYMQEGKKEAGKYAEAEPLLERALRIREKVLPPGDANIAASLDNLANLYRAEGKYADAEPLHRRSLAMSEKQVGKQSPAAASDLNNLAASYRAQGKYAEAESLLKQALEIEEKNFGPEGHRLASSLNNLAEVYRETGKYAEAEQLYLRSLAIEEKASGRDAPELASTLNNLGLLYKQEGRYAEAEPLHWRALTITTKALGKDDLKVAITLNCLGTLYSEQGRHADAEPLYRRSLEIRQKLLRPDHPDIGTAMNNLATVYLAQGKYADAERLERQALGIDEKALGSEHPVVAIDLVNLGDLSKHQSKYADAERLYERALHINEKALGQDHPEVASVLMRLARLYYEQDQYAKAEPPFKRGFENLNRQFQYHFTYMNEQDRLLFLDTVADDFPAYFSFCFKYRKQDPTLIGALYDVVLWQKGLVAGSVSALRTRIAASGDKEALRLLDQLTAKRAEVARLLAAPAQTTAESRPTLDRLEQEANQIERDLVRRSGALAEHSRLARATWQDVQKALGSGEAAVEFIRFRYYDGTRWTGTTQYAALIITPGRTATPALVPIGDADELETAALQDYWHRIAKVPPSEDAGARFYQAFWKPLEAKLAGTKRVYVSPDGVLNQISLAAIPADDGRLLIEKYDLQMVLSTKDLLREKQNIARRSAVLIGNPKFDLSEAQQRTAVAGLETNRAPRVLAAAGNSQGPQEQLGDTASKPSDAARGLRSRDQKNGVLPPLPGTEQEVKSATSLLARHGWQVESYAGQNALEETVKRVKGPRVLHIATHGFFEADQQRRPRGNGGGGSNLEDAMLRSGIYLAGANRVLSGTAPAADLDDGVLTAYEATGLNLQGTELVVLSACETGLGEIKNGEGVFGLHRGLQEAGAQAVLMSMWKVPDQETQELMTLFYENWLSGKDKHAALHEAQLELRNKIKARWGEDRPYYWAAFVLVGR